MPNGDDDTNTTWELDAAVDPVFRLADRDHVSGILQRVNTGASYTVHWRARTVQDQRRTNHPEISAEREWLWRWDRAHPRVIFQHGFLPRVDILRVAAAGPTAPTNLRSYVANNIASVFVSTTRRNWAPRSRGNTFRYDIFAPGGIDVNPTLGQHIYENQMEIAFVGGIRTEYIYGAVELDGRGNQIRYHRNFLYRGPDGPLATRRNVCRLHVVWYRWMQASQPTDYCEAIRPASQKRSTNTELMRSPGEILQSLSDCSYWYKVNIQYLNFDQPAEVGQIEPFGSMKVYIRGRDTYAFEKSDVFRQYSDYDAPSVSKNENLADKAKCLVVHSDVDSDTVQVCFDGNVYEYDPSSGNDQIASFRQKCINTSPSTNPSKSYRMSATGNSGSLKWAFKISPCDQNCLQRNLHDDQINGECQIFSTTS